jgi:matrixin
MRKTMIIFIAGLLALILTLPVLATERPRGLENKGPLTKITSIHYRRGYAKPDWTGGGGKSKEEKCYSFLAKGAKWKSQIGEDYEINPLRSGLDYEFVQTAIDAGTEEWETYGSNIFGTSKINEDVIYDGETWDGVNTIDFGSYPNDNVIAVTTVWGYFSGPPSTREIIEWDMLFNTHWSWGDAIGFEVPVMDLQNIATHELGHSAGMGHPNKTCIEETMYAYSTLDETKKRDLSTGDINGIVELYK